MKESDYENQRSKWRITYRTAISCRAGTQDITRRIAEAEDAISERIREIFRESGDEVEVEREAMDDALYGLRAWKMALQKKTTAA